MSDLLGNPEDRFSRYRAHIVHVKERTMVSLGHRFFIFCFTDFFLQQVSVGGRNKNESKMNFIFILRIKMAISHQVLSLGVI